MDEEIKKALVRIATLYLKVPEGAVTKYLWPEEWKELVRCYEKCRTLVPSTGDKK